MTCDLMRIVAQKISTIYETTVIFFENPNLLKMLKNAEIQPLKIIIKSASLGNVLKHW